MLITLVRIILYTFLLLLTVQVAAQTRTVTTVSPQMSKNIKLLNLTGTVEARQNAKLASLQPGLIASLYVEVGDRVVQGQKLLKLNDTLAKLAVEEANSSRIASIVILNEAKRQFEEVSKLATKKVVAQTLISERKAAVASAQAAVNMEQANIDLKEEILARHSLYAPFDGVITQRNGDKGEWITNQTPVFTLINQDTLWLKVAIPQEYFDTITHHSDLPLLITPDSGQSVPIQGKLDRIVSASNTESRAFTAFIDLSESKQLFSGMSATASIELPMIPATLFWLPKSAIKQHPDGGKSIFSIENNKAKRYLVDVVQTKSDLVAVTGAPSDVDFVTSGVELLNDGDSLTVENTAEKK